MKTKKLIELLQKADPTGEVECCIGNQDIYYVEPLPAYYDGRLQVIERDENKHWIATKLLVKAGGKKVKLTSWSFDDVASSCQDRGLPLPEMDFSEDSHYAEAYKRNIIAVYDSCKMMSHKLDQEYFDKWEKEFDVYIKSGKIEDIEAAFGDIADKSGKCWKMRRWMKTKITDLADWKLDGWFCDKVYKNEKE